MGIRGQDSVLQGPGWDLGATIQCFKGQDAPRMGFRGQDASRMGFDASRVGFRSQDSML